MAEQAQQPAEIAIKVENVSKSFKLPHEKQSSVKSLFINAFRRKKYTKQQALKDINFEVKKGEFFGIVGRNGSGKSTLLKLLAGIYTPNSGSITVNGKLTPFIELGVGFNPELTGRENVFLNGALLGFNRKEMNAMYKEIVNFAELHKFMDQKLKNYSSGMQVRLAFSIAIRAKSDILLIDEVLAVGDALFQKKCYEYFSKLRSEDKTVIFVSHDSEALERFCDRGILIEKGSLLYSEGIRDVVNRYRDLLIDEEAEQTTEQVKTNKKTSRRITITYTQTKNAKGQPTKIFQSADSIKVEVRINTKSAVEKLNCSIGIYNGQYEAHADRVFGASTQLDKTHLNLGTRKITLTIDKPNLRNGSYLCYVVLFGESEVVPYDFSWQVAPFQVKGAPNFTSRGVIMATHTWEDKK